VDREAAVSAVIPCLHKIGRGITPYEIRTLEELVLDSTRDCAAAASALPFGGLRCNNAGVRAANGTAARAA
jgi:hypothetical protein